MNEIVTLAKEFKKRDNIKNIGALVGRVMSPLPELRIGIFKDQIVLSADKLYITESLYQDEKDVSMSGNLSIDGITKSIAGDIKMTVESLKKDDLVMLVPSGSGQEFFVIDKIRKVK